MTNVKDKRAPNAKGISGQLRCFDCGEFGPARGMMLVRRYPYADKSLDLVVYVHRRHGR